MIDNLIIPKSALKPGVTFLATGKCTLYGESRPEELDEFYYEVSNYIKELIKNNVKITFTFDFTYFNTLAQRYLYDLLSILNEQEDPGPVTWLYEHRDETIEDMGDTYKTVYPRLKIKLKEK